MSSMVSSRWSVMRRIAAGSFLIALGAGASWQGSEAVPFRPYDDPRIRIVNAVSFSPDGEEMYMALFHRRWLAERGETVSDRTPELAIYRARRVAPGQWGSPELVPFSGEYVDYEPTLSPDGRILLFNSKRPGSDGRIPVRNDLWMVRRGEGGWGEPERVAVSTAEQEESYSTLDAAGRVIYHVGAEVDGAFRSDLYEAVWRDGQFRDARRLALSRPDVGEGDPLLAPDGSWLIFTRWDEGRGWEADADLYVSFATAGGWSEPVALAAANTPGPDYSAALSARGDSLYYRANHRMVVRALGPLLEGVPGR